MSIDHNDDASGDNPVSPSIGDALTPEQRARRDRGEFKDMNDLVMAGYTRADLIGADGKLRLETAPESPADETERRDTRQAAAIEDPRPPFGSDEALALAFSERHKGDFRYIAKWGRWHRWTGSHWAEDATLDVVAKARTICREASAQCDNAKLGRTIAAARTVAGVVGLARADRHHAATIDQWDANDWLLATPGGTVELKTGKIRPAAHEDFLTRCCAVTPLPEATVESAPLWNEYLHQVTRGNGPLIDYLQRVAGYCLTGSTREHVLFFLYGSGRNGKATFVETLAGIAGDYAIAAPMDMFMASKMERHPTELAGLRGARLATATETESGHRWAESKIKMLTGGDRISARFMRQDFFNFDSRVKFLLSGNHRPHIRSLDAAMRSRFQIVPFNVFFTDEGRDKELRTKLRPEWPAILAWSIEGAQHWQRMGLAPPPAVRDATAGYFESEDLHSRWIEACCTLAPDAEATVADLFASWSQWCERVGERAGTMRSFSSALEARGFERCRIGHLRSRGYRAIRAVLPPD